MKADPTVRELYGFFRSLGNDPSYSRRAAISSAGGPRRCSSRYALRRIDNSSGRAAGRLMRSAGSDGDTLKGEGSPPSPPASVRPFRPAEHHENSGRGDTMNERSLKTGREALERIKVTGELAAELGGVDGLRGIIKDRARAELEAEREAEHDHAKLNAAGKLEDLEAFGALLRLADEHGSGGMVPWDLMDEDNDEEDVKEWREACLEVDLDHETTDDDDIRQRIDEFGLSLNWKAERSGSDEGWQVCGWEWLLTTGGPACRVLCDNGRLTMQWQDWGTPWTDVDEAFDKDASRVTDYIDGLSEYFE